MNKGKPFDVDDEGNGSDEPVIPRHVSAHAQTTPEDFMREEEEIRELEKKKRALEDRVSEMERDLGGLRR